ncbi:2-keto-4-pentenoate hydratase [Pleionea sediminis]|uniref:2-keto-4-pentenoate hydratase n=1 Tax=Pleionea sediminis TaxID=2569479 RepID=UPI0011855089|nr:4-oxalocrotonate decarboxylase [Pleionea sediminis]
MRLVRLIPFLVFTSTLMAGESFEHSLFKRWKNNQPIVHLSSQQNATEEEAYQIQKRYVTLRLNNNEESIAGFKGGLTSKAGQQKFNVNNALAGVLFNSGRQSTGKLFKQSDYGKLMVETELGFLLNGPISTPVKSMSDLKKLVKSVVPVIELPDLGFKQPKSLQGIDIIAANVAANEFIMGKPVSISAIDNLNSLSVTLSRDSQLVNSGKGSDALEDQWQALLWLVNHTVQQGYTIEHDHLLITGALGKMLPGTPGKYIAKFDSLDNIEFVIQ